jgi:hypothetical protein
MKKCFSLFLLFSILFSGLLFVSCDEINAVSPDKTQKAEDGYGIVRFNPSARETSRMVMIPSYSDGTLKLTAVPLSVSGLEPVTAEGTWSKGVKAALRSGIEYKITIDLCKNNSSDTSVKVLTGSTTVTPVSGTTTSASVSLYPCVSSESQSGSLTLKFNMGGTTEDVFSYKVSLDEQTSTDYVKTGDSVTTATVTFTNLAPGRHYAKVGIAEGSGASSANVGAIKIIDAFIYPGLSTQVCLDGADVIEGELNFSSLSSYFAQNETNVNYTLTIDNVGSGSDEFCTEIGPDTEIELTVAQTVPGQKIKVMYGETELDYTGTPIYATSTNTATLSYIFEGGNDGGELYFEVKSPDGKQTYTSPIWNVSIMPCLKDNLSIAKFCGWKKKTDFKTTGFESSLTSTALTTRTDQLGSANGYKFTVYTPAELVQFSYMVANNVTTFKNYTVTQMDDIDLNELNWKPVGTSTRLFMGTFDGNSKEIKNMTVSVTSGYGGLFAAVSSAVIENTTVKDSSVTITGNSYAGGIAGYAENAVTISNCKYYGTVTCSGTVSCAAGIVGDLKNFTGTVTGCEFKGSIVAESSNYAGGIAGCMLNCSGSVENCSTVDSSINGNNGIGGCIGYINNCNVTVKNCTVSGSVSGNAYFGGCVGYILSNKASYGENTIDNCSFNKGNIDGNNCGGGIFGKIDSSSYSKPVIKDCTVSGSIITCGSYTGGIGGELNSVYSASGDYGIFDCTVGPSSDNKPSEVICSSESGTYTGGVIGWAYGTTISGCGFTGTVTANTNSSATIKQVGGIAGGAGAKSSIKNCAFDGTITTTGQYAGGIAGYMGFSSPAFQASARTKDTANIVSFTGNTVAENSKITGGASVGGVAGLVSGLSAITGYNLKNVEVKATVYSTTETDFFSSGGIIGYAEKTDSITDCSITNVTVTANYSYNAGIVGRASEVGTIKDCSASGCTITYSDYLSQLVGNYTAGIAGRAEYTEGGGLIQNCNVTDTQVLNHGSYSAGVIGSANGYILKNCTISGNSTVSTVSSRSGKIVGGICGQVVNGNVSGCKSYAEIVNNGGYAGEGLGGIIGAADGTVTGIDKCIYKGNVSGKMNYAGGIIGYYKNTADDQVYITNCIVLPGSSITVSNGSTQYYAGGVAGIVNNCLVDSCVNMGNVSAAMVAGITCGSNTSGFTNSNVFIQNCVNFGNVTGIYIPSSTADQIEIGGIINYFTKTIKTTNCYSTGFVCYYTDGSTDIRNGVRNSSFMAYPYGGNTINCYFEDDEFFGSSCKIATDEDGNKYLTYRYAETSFTGKLFRLKNKYGLTYDTDGITVTNQGSYTCSDFADALGDAFTNAKTDTNYQYTGASGLTYPLPVSLEGLVP